MKRGLLITAFLLIALSLTSCSRFSVHTSTFKDAALLPNGFLPNSSFYISPLEQKTSLEQQEIKEKIRLLLLSSGYRITEREHADYCLEFSTSIRSDHRKVANMKYVPGLPSLRQSQIYSGGKAVYYNEQQISTGSFVYVPEDVTLYTYKLTVQVKKMGYQGHQVWKGSAITVQQYESLRGSINYLLASTFKHFGKNTGKEVIDGVSSLNSKVKILKKAAD